MGLHPDWRNNQQWQNPQETQDEKQARELHELTKGVARYNDLYAPLGQGKSEG